MEHLTLTLSNTLGANMRKMDLIWPETKASHIERLNEATLNLGH